jgi:hypothetical protein
MWTWIPPTSSCEGFDDGQEHKTLLNAARDLRIAAIPLLPTLMETLQKKAAAVIDAVEQAKSLANSLSHH